MDLDEAMRILDVRPDATLEELQSARRDQVKIWHPDRFQGDERLLEKATRRMQAIQEAWEVVERHRRSGASRTADSRGTASGRPGPGPGAPRRPPPRRAPEPTPEPGGPGASTTVPRHTSRLPRVRTIVALLLAVGIAGWIATRRDAPPPEPLLVQGLGASSGDTIRVPDRQRGEAEVRIFGVDAPEPGQNTAERARRELDGHVRDRLLELTPVSDAGGDLVARVHLDGEDVGVWLLERGLAWHFPRFVDDPTYAAAEARARRSRRGLWKAEDPEPPWLVRHPPAGTGDSVPEDAP